MPDTLDSLPSAGPALVDKRHACSDIHSVNRWLQGWPLAVAALAACWISLFKDLWGEWSVNPQYSYGYVVPLLAAMLVRRRWQERPAPSARGFVPTVLIAGLLLFLLLPLDLIREANPEWRLVYWTHGFLVLGLSFCLLHRAGGWAWVKFFSPPLIFTLIAIPWPMELEQAVIQNLMRFVAGLTVTAVGWLGIPAVQHGNLIEIGAGVVGIDEACSGVRSLQSALMLSLFLGELYRFSARRRAQLVAASLVCVLFANVVRTSFLTWVAANRGFEQMRALHDSAGLLVMAIVLPSLFGLAHWMRPKNPVSSNRSSVTAPTLPPISRWVAVGVFVWMGLAWAMTETWYRSHEQNLVANPRWTVAWPARESHYQKTGLPEETLAILRCSTSDAATWEDEKGNQWSAFFLCWSAGKNSAQLAKGHRPDICFPAAGAKLVHDWGQITVSAHGLDLPFKYQTFQSGPRLLHVFYCLWSDHSSRLGQSPNEDGSWGSRLQAVWAGRRNLGEQALELDVYGPNVGDQAVHLFQQQIQTLIRQE